MFEHKHRPRVAYVEDTMQCGSPMSASDGDSGLYQLYMSVGSYLPTCSAPTTSRIYISLSRRFLASVDNAD